MSLKNQISFSSGELDPILHERVTLERFQNALATARNVMVSKAGTIMSRFGRFLFRQAAYENSPIRVYTPPNSGITFEFGTVPDAEAGPFLNLRYIKLINLSGTVLHTFMSNSSNFSYRIEDLPKLHFVPSGEYLYVFKAYDTFAMRNVIFKIKYTPTYTLESGDQPFVLPQPPGSPTTFITSNGTGYAIDYAYAVVVKGQEVLHFEILAANNASTLKKPISATEQITLVFTITPYVDADLLNSLNEVRIYQRPAAGSAFGYLGRTTNIYNDAGTIKAKFIDLGGNPDYNNGIQSLVTQDGLSSATNVGRLNFNTGVVYQQRLLLGNELDINKEAIVASRPGYQNNFYRDFPVSADSALNFKAGTSGNAEVLRMIDDNGLVVFTSVGVFVSVGILSPDNLGLIKRGPWVIDEDIEPLSIPGGLFFVDKTTSSVRQLVYSQEIASYDSKEQSIFSDHLFKERTIKSWAFHDGDSPMIIVSFSDGTFATFTYSAEQQMKAWTRHDTVYPVEQVQGTGISNLTIFVINKNGNRHIEMTIPRAIPSSVYATNPEAKYLAYAGFMDGLKVKVDLINDGLDEGDDLLLEPVVPGAWHGDLSLTCLSSGIFTLGGLGEPGTIFRHFDLKDKSIVDLEIMSRVDDNEVIVRPSEEFPENQAEDPRLYLTHDIVEGLEHLEGEEVAVMCDGDIMSSPFNDNEQDTMTVLTVIGGEIQFPNEQRSAITLVGRPITADIKTLNITTVEQSPTTIESLTANKLYVRTYDTRGLFVDNQFPENLEGEVDGNSVKDMQTLETYEITSGVPLIGNRSKPGTSKRHELTLPGEWDSNGQISIRQVDPFHFEILSIIADVEILKRSDR